jgi:predicted ATP-dependent endonuclease of OLD family
LELVYLWIEDYKNIKKQGFNFSPRFHCEYDGKELTIKENDDYIENFFGDNINVTAIVGKNGSGKSSVLDVFMKNNYLLKELVYLIVYRTDDNLYFYATFEFNCLSIKKSNFNDELEKYLYLADEQISTNGVIKNRIFLNDHIIGDMLCGKYISKNIFKLTTFMYIPHELEIKLNSLDKMFDDFILEMNEHEEMLEENQRDTEIYARADSIRYDFHQELLLDKESDQYHQFLILWYINYYGYKYDINFDFDNKEYLLLIYKKECEYEIQINENEFLKYFKKQRLEIKNLTTREQKIYFQYYKEYFNFDFIDSKNRRYKHLSYGERTIFGQLLNIYYHSINSEKNNLLFLFDEPDISLHPNWQKQYLSEVIRLFQVIDKKFHIILTSHSPFLLSDIPKQNIIFLDKDEKGNCKVVDGLKEKKQTFGANIHTLLSDSFFMEDGLMGEFAKGKIDEVIAYLNGKKDTDIKNDDEAQKLINIIGEPIVKNQLQRMLDSKRLSKVDKIDVIERQIKELQEELKKVQK